jgi:hypothetical protein
MGLGCGKLTCIHVGGVLGRWEYVVAGDPLSQIAIAEPMALNGETVVAPEAWELIAHCAKGELLSDIREREVCA